MKIFLSGIDTDAGKTYAAAWLANRWRAEGKSVITQKLIQTGNVGMSEDIEMHRQLMGIPLQPRDLDHTTAPIILSYPASAELAAKIDGVEIDMDIATRSTEVLEMEYDIVIIEGAGGLMVPIKDDYLAVDYAKERQLPVVLVTNGRLGSINHTLLSLLAIKEYGLELLAVVYNSYFDKDETICQDTKRYIREYLRRHFPEAEFLVMEKMMVV